MVQTAPMVLESSPAALPAPPGPPLTSYSLHDGEVVRLDLRNERIEPLAGIPAIDGAREISSLALVEDHLIACQSDENSVHQLLVVGLASKRVERTQRPCEAIASDGTRIWLRPTLMEQKLVVYSGLGALLDDRPSGEQPAPHPTSRLGTGGDRLFAAWHSSDHVVAIDANGGTRELPLAKYDGWIFGVGATGGQIFVVGGWAEKGIRVFDIENGSLVRTLFASERLNGLTMPQRML
jgi:hypothetical protein